MKIEREPAVPWFDVAALLRPYIARRVPESDIDDVVQDVLLRMHRGLGALRDEERFTGWMFQIARTAIVERARDRARHPLAAEDVVEPVVDEADDDRQAADALAACLLPFVARLASPYREAITLIELEGMTVRRSAVVVGLSVSGMKSRVQRGRAQLREMLEACCEIAVDARGAVIEVTPQSQTSCCSPSSFKK